VSIGSSVRWHVAKSTKATGVLQGLGKGEEGAVKERGARGGVERGVSFRGGGLLFLR